MPLMPVRAEDLAAAEHNLGVVFPEDYRAMLITSDGLVEMMPSAYLQLWPLADVVRINGTDQYGLAQSLPGLLLIGSDGGGELLGYDVRNSPVRLVLVNAISESWADTLEQGDSLSALMARLLAGGEYRFSPGP